MKKIVLTLSAIAVCLADIYGQSTVTQGGGGATTPVLSSGVTPTSDARYLRKDQSDTSSGTITATGGFVAGGASTITGSAISLNSTNGNTTITGGALAWAGGASIANIYRATASLAFPAQTPIGTAYTNNVTVTGAIPDSTRLVILGRPSDCPDNDSIFTAKVTATNTVSVVRTCILSNSAYTNTFEILVIK